ncbi:DegT/DnrJ/EryC1/StrS family aminotransferase [Candidatus Dojkabacteria bacterium]|jgi:dTDP-4-amino-4,6-dideoxygalactose transaminase|nr:DegT/DnrJ/EryC1/StrS family aminotransferase [Candidatus Dojkabacteria bacterium]
MIDFINSSYRRYYSEHREEILDAIDRCFKGGDFILRKDVEEFEQKLCAFTGAKYAVGVNSGTDALKLSYKAMGIKPGDEVITVSHTFIAPIEEIVHHGGIPILIDVGEDGLMNVDEIESAISPQTVGIVPVHLSGKVCDMKRINEIAEKHGLWVVEDACQALGAKLDGKSAGTMGNTGCFSFISPKTLGGAGDNGGIITNDFETYQRLLLLRNHWNITQGALHGLNIPQPEVMDWGYNSRMDNIQAAILNIKWKYYPEMLKRRKEIGEMYNEGLKDLPILLPTSQPEQIYQEYIIRVKNREKFMKHMVDNGIELLVRDTIPNHKQRGLKLDHFDLPVTEEMATDNVRIPCYPELEDEEVAEIIKVVKSFYK